MLDPKFIYISHLGILYSLYSDASDYQLRCSLFQKYPESIIKPIGFWYLTLNKTEVNYYIPEKECLAVYYDITTCLLYRYGETFAVHTYYNFLRWLVTITEPSNRLLWCRLRLLEYEYDLYVKNNKVNLNKQLDAQFRFQTDGHTTIHEYTDIPCFSMTTNEIQPKKKGKYLIYLWKMV